MVFKLQRYHFFQQYNYAVSLFKQPWFDVGNFNDKFRDVIISKENFKRWCSCTILKFGQNLQIRVIVVVLYTAINPYNHSYEGSIH